MAEYTQANINRPDNTIAPIKDDTAINLSVVEVSFLIRMFSLHISILELAIPSRPYTPPATAAHRNMARDIESAGSPFTLWRVKANSHPNIKVIKADILAISRNTFAIIIISLKVDIISIQKGHRIAVFSSLPQQVLSKLCIRCPSGWIKLSEIMSN